jgi:hypothetical protein
MLESHFFAFLFWQRAYHRPSPLQGTRTNFLDAALKIGSGPTLQRGPCPLVLLLLPIKRRKNEGAPGPRQDGATFTTSMEGVPTMTKAEQRRIALGAARSQLRHMGVVIDTSLSFQNVLAVLDDLHRSEPDLIASHWYAQATDYQMKLLRQEWKKQFSTETTKSCPISGSSIHQPVTLWQACEMVV